MGKSLLAIFATLAVLAGILVFAPATPQAADVVIEPGWRFTNGYWNYWDPDDRAWYYTDGRHWYTHDNNAWTVYKFDRKFGRKAFVREGYVAPGVGVEVTIPKHKIYIP